MKITANMVTLGRIVLLPIPAAILVWGDTFWVWMATLFAIALGATDAVDGYLARRDGPTVLGSLLDPVADKLFLAAFLLPITAKGHAAAWVVAVIFARELLITALRSSMELRRQRLVTSQLGKLKTVVQMGGLGIYAFLTYTPPPFPRLLNAIGVAGMCLVAVIYLAKKKRPPYWVTGTIPLWMGILALTFVLPLPEVTYWLFVVLAVITWLSGVDYLWGAMKVFRQTGVTLDDMKKLYWGVGNALVLPVVAWHAEALLPVMLTLAAHLSLGGIDNIVTAESHKAVRFGFVLPTTLSIAALVTTFFVGREEPWIPVVVATSAAALAGAVVAGIAFVQHKALFFPHEVARD